MENELIVFTVVVITLFYGFFSKLLEKFNISGPMIFLLIGMILSPLGFDFIVIALDSQGVEIVAEIALVIVLFSDSSSLNLKGFKTGWQMPTRLLFIGLPLTIIFSSYVATLMFPNEPFLYLLVMALVLAPTDAALGKAVVTRRCVPRKIRSAINVESGLNDGIVFPILITALLLIVAHKEFGSDSSWGLYLLKQIALGVFVGTLSGFIGAKILNYVMKKKWVEDVYINLSPVSLAILIYFIAEYLGGNGFIAAFVGGASFGNFSTLLRGERKVFLESEGEVLILISFLIFGLTFIPATYQQWDLEVFAYAFMSLTFFRIFPVFISLIGIKIPFWSKMFIAWFGPRGIASILYVMTVARSIESADLHNKLFSVISLTILLSIILHGLSAKPLANLYAKKFKI